MNCLAVQCNKPVTDEITSPRTIKILKIHKHWPQQIPDKNDSTVFKDNT